MNPITPRSGSLAALPIAAVAASGVPVVFVPAERTAIFPQAAGPALLRAVCYIAPPGITGYWAPTQTHLNGVETELQDYLSLHHREPRNDWDRYYRQVTGVRSGRREDLFLSYFPLPRSDDEWAVPKEDPRRAPDGWKRVPFWINNGGNDYFRVIYSPENKAFSWYEQNNTNPSFTPEPPDQRP